MKGYQQVKDRWSTRAGEWISFALAWCFVRATGPVPIWTLAGILAPIGSFLAVVIPGARTRVMENLDYVWPDLTAGEKRRILKATGAEFIRLVIEYVRFSIPKENVEVRVTGIEHLEAARDAGMGAVLVTAHLGNWEAIRLAAQRAGCESGIIYRAFNNRYVDRYARNLIAGLGEPVLHKGRRGMRRLVAHVAHGGTMLIVVDQRTTGAPMLPFLGKPAETVTAAAALAARTGAALIPAVARRNVDERCFEVIFEPPVTGPNPEQMMSTVNDRISCWIEETPEQWFWFHHRWKTTAPNTPEAE